MTIETINNYQDFLKKQSRTLSTIKKYSRMIGNLEEPHDDSPEAWFSFIENITDQKKECLSRSNYNQLHAALGALFTMKIGKTIKEYVKESLPEDPYDPILKQYADYCNIFLHLTPCVTQAAVRETRLFLKYVTKDPFKTDWSSITAMDVTSFLKLERSNLKTSSIGVTVTAIRRFFRFLQHNDFDIHMSVLNLPLSVPNWSKNVMLPVTLTENQQKTINSHIFPNTPTGLRDHAILLCFTELGLRCSEVANLQLEDIRWNSGTIVIRKTKTHAERELPLSVKLGTALEDYVIQARSPELGITLFHKSKYRLNEPASKENVRGVIRRLFNKEGIIGKNLGTHALRRTVGSRLYNSGNGLKTVADLLGHTSVSTTKSYVRIDFESLRTVASQWPEED